MKNLQVRTKLFVAFSIVIMFTLILSVTAMRGLYILDRADTRLYEQNYGGTSRAFRILDNLTGQRTLFRDVILSLEPIRGLSTENAVAALRASEQEMQKLIDDYASWSTFEESLAEFNQFRTIYETDFKEGKERIIQRAQLGDANGALAALTGMVERYKVMAGHINKMVELNAQAAKNSVDDNTNLYIQMLILQIGMLFITLTVAVFVTIYISKLISKPLRYLAQTLDIMSIKGDLKLDKKVVEEGVVYSKQKDEIGEIAKSILALIKMLYGKVKTLEIVAAGDLTASIDHISKEDTIANALQSMVDNLNQMFIEINSASEQVSTGSQQVATGSQLLAQGSMQQASAVQELSSSITEVAEKTNLNATMAKEAAALSNTIRTNAVKGSTQMDNMMQAVKEINEASNSISKVIKAIDDIAFQTNILALNAAVEAARAGQYGKGFAVVADEVRNLAAKSAIAAKDTGSLIENSIIKANLGFQIATETSTSLSEIVDGINKSAEIITDIANSSEYQADAITQINHGIEQVAQVVQQNSATAEQSAASSEEMSSQSALLQGLVARFKIKKTHTTFGEMDSRYTQDSDIQNFTAMSLQDDPALSGQFSSKY